jgi:hypothetical protein
MTTKEKAGAAELAKMVADLQAQAAQDKQDHADALARVTEERDSANERVKRVSSTKQLELKSNQFSALSLEPAVHKGFAQAVNIPPGSKVQGKGQLQLDIDCQVTLSDALIARIREEDFDSKEEVTVTIIKRLYLWGWFGKSKNGVAYMGGFINEGADEWSGYQLVKVIATDPRSDFVTDEDGNQRPTTEAKEAAAVVSPRGQFEKTGKV